MPTKIFIGNISSTADQDELKALFEQYGQVAECDIVGNYAFVHMVREKDATKAIEHLHESDFAGAQIRCEISTRSTQGRKKQREADDEQFGESPSRGGRGGGRGRGDRGRGRGGRGSGRFEPYGSSSNGYGRSGAPPAREYPEDRYDRYAAVRRPLPPLYPGERRAALPPLDDDRADPYARDLYVRDLYERDPYARDPYYLREAYARDPYYRDLYARDPYRRDPYARDPYARELPPPRDPLARDPYDLAPPRDPYTRPPPEFYQRGSREDPLDDLAGGENGAYAAAAGRRLPGADTSRIGRYAALAPVQEARAPPQSGSLLPPGVASGARRAALLGGGPGAGGGGLRQPGGYESKGAPYGQGAGGGAGGAGPGRGNIRPQVNSASLYTSFE